MSNEHPSFATQYADPAMGFNVVPRWFRASPFWNALKPDHRVILDEMFHMVRRLPYRWKDQIDVGRGQFVMSLDAVAERCHATRKQVRLVMEKAEEVGIFGHRVLTWAAGGKTHRILLVTWHDFDAYDRPQEKKGTSTGISPGTSEGISTGTNKTESTYTPAQTEHLDREERVGAAPPPAALSGGSPQAVERKPKSPTARKPKPAPVDVATVCSGLEPMKAYLLAGDLNWERHQKSETDLGVENWGAREFMGFYWFQVSAFRTHKNIPLSLPSWGKLGGHFRNLLGQMPKQNLYGVISYVIFYFDVIRWMLRRAGNTVFLDEDSLMNPLVKQTANNLMRMSEDERAGLVAQFRAETQAAAA